MSHYSRLVCPGLKDPGLQKQSPLKGLSSNDLCEAITTFDEFRSKTQSVSTDFAYVALRLEPRASTGRVPV